MCIRDSAANIARKEEAAAALGAAAAETLATLRDRDAHSAVSDADLAVVREAVKAGALTAEEAEALGSRAAAVPRLGLNRRSVTSRDGYIRP